MSEQPLKAFLEKIKADTTIQDKLKAARSPADVVAIAKEHGHEFTADKFSQLSEMELEHLAGGWPVLCCLTEAAPSLNAETDEPALGPE